MSIDPSSAVGGNSAAHGAAPPVQSPLGGVGLAAVLYTLLFGVAVLGVLRVVQTEPEVIDIGICLAPALLALVLARTSRADRQQYVARLMACAAMLPLLLLMWAGSQPVTVSDAVVWSAAVGLFVVHMGVFVLAVFWLARLATRIETQPGAALVGSALLGLRFMSLVDQRLPVDVTAGPRADEWLVSIRFSPGVPRSHRIRLRVDETRRMVRVRERLGARGAAPADSDEASLRSIGDTWFDPARPQAQRVSGITLQATMIEPARMAATRVAMEGGQAAVLSPAAGDLDPDGVIAVLAAVVTRSGYVWQPELGTV